MGGADDCVADDVESSAALATATSSALPGDSWSEPQFFAIVDEGEYGAG